MIRIAAPIAVAAVSIACSVEEKAGFEVVEAAALSRLDKDAHWRLGTAEDEAVAARVGALLAGELTIDEAVQVAILNDPELQSAYEDLGIGRADLVQAGLLENPSFSAQVGIPGIEAPIQLGFEVVADFLELLVLEDRRRLAEEAFRTEAIRVAMQVVEVATGTAVAYRRFQASMEAAELELAAVREARADLEWGIERHQAGQLDELDLTELRAAHEGAKVDLTRAEFDALSRQDDLATGLGLWGTRAEFRISPQLPGVPGSAPRVDELEARAVQGRLDLAAARREAERLADAVETARDWRWVSRIDAGGRVERESDEEAPILAGPIVSFELPVFDQGQAEVARLESELRRSRRRAEALAIGVRAEAREAARRVIETWRSARHYQEELVPVQDRISDLTRRQVEAGRLGASELVEARRREVEVERRALEAVRDHWIAREELVRAMGGRVRGPGP